MEAHEEDVDTGQARTRFGRYGRLAPQLGVPASAQVRACCRECEAHLLAIPRSDGTLIGTCPVCLSQAVTAVAARHAAA